MSFVLVPRSAPRLRSSMARGVRTVSSTPRSPAPSVPGERRLWPRPWWHCSRRDYRPWYSAAPALCTGCPLTEMHGPAASSVRPNQICRLTFVRGGGITETATRRMYVWRIHGRCGDGQTSRCTEREHAIIHQHSHVKKKKRQRWWSNKRMKKKSIKSSVKPMWLWAGEINTNNFYTEVSNNLCFI